MAIKKIKCTSILNIIIKNSLGHGAKPQFSIFFNSPVHGLPPFIEGWTTWRVNTLTAFAPHVELQGLSIHGPNLQSTMNLYNYNFFKSWLIWWIYEVNWTQKRFNEHFTWTRFNSTFFSYHGFSITWFSTVCCFLYYLSCFCFKRIATSCIAFSF